MLIALLMVVGGALLVQNEERGVTMHLTIIDWGMLAGGILLMLYAFMADALSALPADTQTLSQLRPSAFNWLVFLTGFALAVLFVWHITKLVLQKYQNGG